MEEMITLDGKLFKLTTNRPLTALERQQTISDIRRQSGCSSCNKTQNLGNGIQTLAASCVDITVEAPASIDVTSISVGSDTCPGGVCTPIVCSDLACTSMAKDVVVRFTNSGDVDGSVTPTLTVGGLAAVDINGVAIAPTGGSTVLANSFLDVTWAGVALVRSQHLAVCVSY